MFYVSQSDLGQALAIGQQRLKLAKRVGDDELLLEVHSLVDPILQYQCKFQASVVNLEQALTIYCPSRDRAYATVYGQEPGVVSQSLLAISLWQAGYPDRSLASMQEAIVLAPSGSHHYGLAVAQSFVANLSHLRGEPVALRPAAAEGANSTHKYGYQYWLMIWTMCGAGRMSNWSCMLGWADRSDGSAQHRGNGTA